MKALPTDQLFGDIVAPNQDVVKVQRNEQVRKKRNVVIVSSIQVKNRDSMRHNFSDGKIGDSEALMRGNLRL